MKITYSGSYNGKDYFRDEKGCYVDDKGEDIFVPCSVIDKLNIQKKYLQKRFNTSFF